jgi:L-ascorbate metabolism protein UlaG (beta-lactamase superfamily)
VDVKPGLLAAFLLAVALPADAAEIRARFIGNMSLQLTDGSVTLRSDFPYQSGYSGYNTWTDSLVPPAAGEALCLVTHSHRDHFAAELAERYCQKLVGPADVTRALPQRALAMAPGVRFGPIAITPVETPHAGLEHYSYLVEWSGLRFYFTGDTEDPDALLRQRELDVAFVSPWLLAAATKDGRRIDARRVVVYHHTGPGSRPSEAQPREVPRQGDELLFEAKKP